MKTIKQVGTFDLENYGDLLYPIILRRLLERLRSKTILRNYSLVGGEAPHQAGFRTDPITDLFDSSQGPNHIVIGGGDLLRTDCDVIAAHYAMSYGGNLKTIRSATGPLDSIGYLIRKSVPRINESNYFAERFQRRRLNYRAVVPFIIDPSALPSGSVVSYLSCGVPHEFGPDERDKVARTLERANFIYLRDEQSAEKLRRAGVRSELNVAPDLIVTLAMFFDYDTEVRKGRELIASYGVDRDRPLLCFQSKPYPGFSEAEIAGQLTAYRERTGSEVILMPLGYCHQDRAFLQGLARHSGGTLKYVDPYSIFDIISIIAASSMFVGTSLHGAITAFSFGIPHLLGPLPADKGEGFLHAVESPPQLKLNSWAEIKEKIEFAGGLGRRFFLEKVQKAQTKVLHVVDAIFGDELK